jgi:lysophospholipase L1-like esterase
LLPIRIFPSAILAACVALAGACSNNPVAPPPPPPPTPDPPKISCPVPVSVTSTNGQPLPVSYGSATATLGAPPVTTACTPPSGSTFGIGTTTVTCTATDSLQRTDSCTFGITVVLPPQISLARFVAFGDSITWGEDGQNVIMSTLSDLLRPHFQVPAGQTYPAVLQRLLATRYTLQSISVVNAGNPGELVGNPETLSRFSRTIAGSAVQAVLIMEGSNDVGAQLAVQTTAPVDAAIRNLGTMIRDARSRGMQPFLATIPPENPLGTVPARRGGAATFVPPFNDRIRTLASSEAAALVDVYTALNSDLTTYIGPDGLHPTVAGYAKIADTFFTTLRGTLETTPNPTITAPASLPVHKGLSATPAAASPGSRPVARRPR